MNENSNGKTAGLVELKHSASQKAKNLSSLLKVLNKQLF